jgi:hypothetical protein
MNTTPFQLESQIRKPESEILTRQSRDQARNPESQIRKETRTRDADSGSNDARVRILLENQGLLRSHVRIVFDPAAVLNDGQPFPIDCPTGES